MPLSKVWIVDFGSQYTQLIARRVRESQVFCEIVTPDIRVAQLQAAQVQALILSGGPASVHTDSAPRLDESIFDLELPILGICYGLQLMAAHFGARVHSDQFREYGRSQLLLKKSHPILTGVEAEKAVWMSHGDHVDTIPEQFEIIALSQNGAPAILAHRQRPLIGLQFHPEVMHTVQGRQILNNFLFAIAHLEPNWTPGRFIEQAIESVKQQVGKAEVLMALSGGVDSSVMGVLLQRALGKQCHAVFINHGLLRQNEQQQVIQILRHQMKLPIKVYNFAPAFLKALKGVSDPERKRKIIGREFIRAFEKIAQQYPEVTFLAQGTLYPDVIESRHVKGPSQVIKSHHNVGGLPARMNFKLVEPFNMLFKDEVRRIGAELGLPAEILNRHPFPGPGLAVRIIGPVTARRLDLLRRADAIFIDELRRSGWYDQVWQAFAVLLPVRSVGVMGDQRTYENVCVLRAVNSSDGMTADWSRLPEELLSRIANRIVNEVRGINRIVYDITSKPPATIEWE